MGRGEATQGFDDPWAIIVNAHHLRDFHSHLREPVGKPGGIGIDDLAPCDFGSDTEDGGCHGW